MDAELAENVLALANRAQYRHDGGRIDADIFRDPIQRWLTSSRSR